MLTAIIIHSLTLSILIIFIICIVKLIKILRHKSLFVFIIFGVFGEAIQLMRIYQMLGESTEQINTIVRWLVLANYTILTIGAMSLYHEVKNVVHKEKHEKN